MQPSEFITLAGKLASMNLGAAGARSAVGRAYYGAFHLAKGVLDEFASAPPRNGNGHVLAAARCPRVAMGSRTRPRGAARASAPRPFRSFPLRRRTERNTENGKLKNQVHQDSQYRWWPAQQAAPEPAAEKSPPLPKTPLGRLCQYYLDCLGHELESGVSTFASSKYGDPSFAELAGNPFATGPSVMTGEDVRRVVNKYRTKKNQLVLFLGYPTRLRLQKSRRSNWEGFMVQPCIPVSGRDG